MSPPTTGSSLDFADLAAAVLDLVDAVQEERGEPTGPFAYAGDSAGGAAGLQLLVDAPDRVRAAVILSSSAAFGGDAGLDRPSRRRAGLGDRVAGAALAAAVVHRRVRRP